MSLNSKFQNAFNYEYITVNEIAQFLNVTRSAVFYMRDSNRLPDAIRVSEKSYIWKRENITPYLNDIKSKLNSKCK